MFIGFLRVISLLLLFLFTGGILFLSDRTHVNALLPLGVAACVAVAAACTLGNALRNFTGIRNRALNIAVLMVAFTIMADFAILTANYTGASEDSSREVSAELIEKHVRTEYGTRRVGRGRYVRDSSHKIYHYEYTLRLPDGSTIKKDTDAGHYTRLRRGQHMTVELREGAFGWTVVR